MNYYIIILFLGLTLSVNAQKIREVVEKFDSGEIKTEKITLKDNPNRYKNINYFKSGAVHSDKAVNIALNKSINSAYAEDGTLLFELAIQPLNESSPYEVHFFRVYHTNGNIYKEGAFINRDGFSHMKRFSDWKTYTDDGKLQQLVSYDFNSFPYPADFVKGSSYFTNGMKKVNLSYGENLSDGVLNYNVYYPNGVKHIEALFNVSLIEGIHFKKTLENINILINSPTRIYSKVFNKGKDNIAGSYKIYYPNGKLYLEKKSGSLTEDKFNIKDELLISDNFYPNIPENCIFCTDERKEKDKRCNFKKNGPKDGKYFIEGIKKGRLATFKDGNAEGEVISFDRNGNRISSIFYVKGKKDGPFKFWDNVTGNLMSEGNFIYDKKDKDPEYDIDDYRYRGVLKTYAFLDQKEEEVITFNKEGSKEGYSKILGAGAYLTGEKKNDRWTGIVKAYDIYTNKLLSEGKEEGFNSVGEHIDYFFNIEESYPPTTYGFGIIKKYYNEKGEKVKQIIW